MILPKESATFSSCRFNFFRTILIPNSRYEIIQILGISLTDKTHLRGLFDKSNFKNVNGLYGSGEPNYFNF